MVLGVVAAEEGEVPHCQIEKVWDYNSSAPTAVPNLLHLQFRAEPSEAEEPSSEAEASALVTFALQPSA